MLFILILKLLNNIILNYLVKGRRNGVDIIVNKRVQCAVLGDNLKKDRMISVYFQGKPSNITVIQVYAPSKKAKEAEVEYFYEDLQDHLQLTPKKKKKVFSIIGDKNAKVGSQVIPGVTGKFGLGVQNEAGQSLTEFCQENTLVIANTLFQQYKRRLYTGYHKMVNTTPDGLYSLQLKMEKLYTVSKNETKGWLWLRSWSSYCKIQASIKESRENH